MQRFTVSSVLLSILIGVGLGTFINYSTEIINLWLSCTIGLVWSFGFVYGVRVLFSELTRREY